jgi:putative tryptophan/tyrosine transport system substrate-binding protein
LIPEFVAELVKSKVDVIYASGAAGIRAAQQATATIPILGITQDMVGQGLVNSLARPGGNTTGVSVFGTELDGKRQDILIEAVPGFVAWRSSPIPRRPAHRSFRHCRTRRAHAASRFRYIESSAPRRSRQPSTRRRRRGGAALNVLSSPLLYGNRQLIIDRVAALRLPAIYPWAEEAEEGGFLAYGPRVLQIFRELLAQQLVKLLRGVKLADIPIEQPTKFELVINLKTANAMGVTVPAILVARADKVIE